MCGIPLCEITICLILMFRDIVLPVFGYCEENCYEHSCACFFNVHRHALLLDVYHRIGLLGHRAGICLVGIDSFQNILPF